MIEIFESRLESIIKTIGICKATYIDIKEGEMFCPENLKEGMVDINLKMVRNLNIRKEEVEYTLSVFKLQEKSDSLMESVDEYKLPDGITFMDCSGEVEDKEKREHLENLKEATERTQDINQSKNTGKGCDVLIINEPDKWTPKSGDKVRVKTWDEIKALPGHEHVGSQLMFNGFGFHESMKSLSNKIFIIEGLGGPVVYCLVDESPFFYPEWLEYLPNEN